MTLTTAQLDRAVGVLLGTAAGDALGGPYEFGPPRGPELEVAMVGCGSFGWEPGEWTDDSSMAIAIAEIAATGGRKVHSQSQFLPCSRGRYGRTAEKALAVLIIKILCIKQSETSQALLSLRYRPGHPRAAPGDCTGGRSPSRAP
jgi:ADP-ribosylglycohydrolase